MTKKIAYCTIASANYLSRVEVLDTSLRAHNPDASLHILLCELPAVCRTVSAETGRAFITPEDVCSDWLHMAFYYDITECNTAYKPFLIEHLFEQGYDAVVYIDPDIEIFGSFAPLEQLLQEHDLVLTPHMCKPVPLDGLTPGIDSVVRAGQFNLGFIGLGNSAESRAALTWWQDACREHCIFDGRHRYFVDQFWADILPSFIQKFHCLRDPGYNMAYWNVFQRELRNENGKWMTEAGELKFFHFSGFAKNDLVRVSVHQNRVSAPVGSPLHALMTHYLERISSAKWTSYNSRPYSFGSYSNGEPVLPAERRSFLRLSTQERSEFGNPFEQPAAVKGIVHVDIEQLHERSLLFGYGARRYLRYGVLLFREYIRTIKAKGFVTAHMLAVRLVYRKSRRMLLGSGR